MKKIISNVSDKLFFLVSYINPNYNWLDGRYIAFVIAFIYHALYGFYPTGRWHNSSPFGKPFWDTWVVLRAIECLDGINRNDGIKCFFNFVYPKPGWKVFALFPVNSDHYEFYGIALMLLFFISSFFIFKKLTIFQGVLLGLIFISFPVQLGINSGNPDLFIYCLLIVSAYVFQKTKMPLIAQSIIFFTGMLKYYSFTLHLLLVKKRIDVIWVSLFVLLGFIYILLTRQDVEIATTYFQANESAGGSFGCAVFFKLLASYSFLDFIFKNISYKLMGECLLLLVLLFSFYSYRNSDFRKYSISNVQNFSFTLFQFGYFLYLSSFMLGVNFDYRLIFLLFLLPFIFEQMTISKPRITISLLVLIIIFLIHSFGIDKISFLLYTAIEEFANWFLLYLLTYIFLSTLPENIQLIIGRYSTNKIK